MRKPVRRGGCVEHSTQALRWRRRIIEACEAASRTGAEIPTGAITNAKR